jgi:hypothetical protein
LAKKLRNQFVKPEHCDPGFKQFREKHITSHIYPKGSENTFNFNVFDGKMPDEDKLKVKTVYSGSQSRVISDRRLASKQGLIVDFRNSTVLELSDPAVPQLAAPEAVYSLTHFV